MQIGGMVKTREHATLSQKNGRKRSAAVALTALGVVYGDIGTSTLYGLKQAVQAGGAPAWQPVLDAIAKNQR